MTALACYRIRREVGSAPIREFVDVLDDPQDPRLEAYGPIDGRNFKAQLFVSNSPEREARWARFVRSGFGDEVRLARVKSPAAVVLVDVGEDEANIFAFTFGYAGRFLIRDDSYERGYGLRACLNILYPREAADVGNPARIRALRSKRRGSTVVRSDIQSSDASTFETFDVNRLRDVVSAATGVPADSGTWGRRVTGGDQIQIDLPLSFDELGDLCRNAQAVHDRDDYKDGFGWIDDIKPVTDPYLIARLRQNIVNRLIGKDFEGLTLAPPEIVNWELVSGFRFSFDPGKTKSASALVRPELRIEDYTRGLGDERLKELDVERLRRSPVHAVDNDGGMIHRWTVWRCLVAEIEDDGQAYILDEGEFFAVDREYLQDLNASVDAIVETSVDLPGTRLTTWEKDYNLSAAEESDHLLLMDRKLVRIRSEPSPIELCDLLSTSRDLVHVKRHLGSSDLSHLFAQGVVSAALLQENSEFRLKAQERIDREAGDERAGYSFFTASPLETRDFTIVYAIIEAWRERTPSEALPFFSKMNLREASVNLGNREFHVAFKRIEAAT